LRIAAIGQVLRIAGVDAHARPHCLTLRDSKAAGQNQDCHRGEQTFHRHYSILVVVLN
jgi:hypothetical protein